MQVKKSIFGKTDNNEDIIKYTITNKHSISVSLLNYGATVCSVMTPDKHNQIEEITICYDNFDDLSKKSPHYGSTVGRVANRIAKGQFSIGLLDYKLAINDPPNHLHGGLKAFDKVIWNAHIKSHEHKVSIEFRYQSPDGEEGYPGNLDTTVTYTLTNQNQFIIDFDAKTDHITPVNLTNHAYWNLTGNAKENILGHKLQFYECDYYLVNDDHNIPIGVILPTKDTAYDFTTPHLIGERIDSIKGNPGGYDNCWILCNGNLKKELKQCVTAIEPKSGRKLEIATTYGGVQFYTGNFMKGEKPPHSFRYGFCIECQYWPDAVNQKLFPPIMLEPGQTYNHTTVHTFSVDK